MYDRSNKNRKILNILLGVIALFVIIFIISWIVSKGTNKNNYNEVFKTNLETMQEEAKKYFANELPSEIGDTSRLSLDEMYATDLIDILTYGDVACDTELSYISITKVNETEYKVKSNLVCGNKSDSITEKIKATTKVDDENGNTIIDDEQENVDLEVETNKNETTDKNDTVNCIGPVCSFTQIETTCQTTYEYEYVKRNVSCPDGYTYQNGICVREKVLTTNATPNYSDEKVIIIDAKINKGTSYNRYTDAIVSGGDKYSYCKTGDMKNGLCYEYTNKVTNTSTSCPDGYEKKNNACYKYADLNTSSTTTYSCPSGYDEIGSGANMKCRKIVNANASYTKWSNPSGTYSSYNEEKTYEYELEKKVLVGKIAIPGTNKTVYTYAIYNRSIKYTCNEGEKVDSKCHIYTDVIKNTNSTSSCPNGYDRSGDTCYKKADLITTTSYTCPNGYNKEGAGANLKCYKTSSVSTGTTEKTYSCPAGYNKEGSGANLKCYKTYYNSDTYYCENEKATLKGTSCYLTIPSQYTGSTCPDGYDISGNRCIKTTTETTSPVWSNSQFIYSSATTLPGYQKTGVAKFVTTCTPVEEIHYK